MDWRATYREFVRRARPADADQVAAARLRRRVMHAEGATVAVAGVAAFGGADSGGGGGGGHTHDGGLYFTGSVVANPNSNYTDDFGGDFINPWWSVWKQNGAGWGVAGGVLAHPSPGLGSPRPLASIAYNLVELADCTVRAEIFDDVNQCCVFARASWDGALVSGYAVRAHATAPVLYRVDAGAATALASPVDSFAIGDDVGIECEGTTIRILKNGVAIDSAIDATYASGFAGVGVWQATGASYEWFSIAEL